MRIRIFVICPLLFAYPVNSISCFDCRSVNYGELQCNDYCEGEMCIVWKWKAKSELHIQQGCLTGIGTLPGCRKNNVGAQLCICNDGDLCNRVERAENTIQPLPTRYLPSVSCQNNVKGSPIFNDIKSVCRSNYCHYVRTTSHFGYMGRDSLTVSNCAEHPEFDFDIRIRSTVNFPGLHPNGVYRIMNIPNTETVNYICSTNNCSTKAMPSEPLGHVRCYVFTPTRNINISQSKLPKQHFCSGDFCYLQMNDGILSKGCLSANERSAKYGTEVGYRKIMRTEQWLCNTNLCNWDLERINISLTPPPKKVVNHANFTQTFIVIHIVLLFANFVV